MNWKKFKHITIPTIAWYCGWGLIDNLISFWHLKIAKKPPLWPDADSKECKRIVCRFCGKYF